MHHYGVFSITPCDSCKSFLCRLCNLDLSSHSPPPVSVRCCSICSAYFPLCFSLLLTFSLFPLFNLLPSPLDPLTAFSLPIAFCLSQFPLAAHFRTTKMFSWWTPIILPCVLPPALSFFAQLQFFLYDVWDDLSMRYCIMQQEAQFFPCATSSPPFSEAAAVTSVQNEWRWKNLCILSSLPAHCANRGMYGG